PWPARTATAQPLRDDPHLCGAPLRTAPPRRPRGPVCAAGRGAGCRRDGGAVAWGRAAAPAGAGAEAGRLPSSLRRCPGSLALVLLDRTPRLRAPGRVRRAVGPTPAQEHGRAAVFPAGCAVPLRLKPG